jgi:hypothetical protein
MLTIVVLLALPTIVLFALPNITLMALWGVVGGGMCGTIYPGWHPGPSDPEPWAVYKIIGIVTGILGGWAYTQMFGVGTERWEAALPAALSCVGAFSVAVLAGQVYGKLAGGKRTAL